MKKILIVFFAFATTSVFAQGLYVQPGISFHIGSDKDAVGLHVKNIGEANQTTTVLFESYGNGFSTDLEVGYFFNKHVAANLGFSYVIGSEVTIEDFEYNSANERDFSVAKNKRMTLSPGFTIDAALDGKLSPYARIGLLMPVGGKTDGTSKSNNCISVFGDPAICDVLAQSFESFEATSIIKGKFTVGVTASLGLRYEVSDMVSIFGAVNYNSLHIKRNTNEITGAKITYNNGNIEDIKDLLVATHIEYKAEINAQEFATYQTSAGDKYGTEEFPAWDLDQSANFSTVGINIGARLNFGGGDE